MFENFSGNILCMGGINMDLVMYLDHLPTPAETIVTDNFNTFPGGKGGNQAVSASQLGGRVRFFGKLGKDSFSNELLQSMTGSGVDVSDMLRVDDQTAGIAMIWVDKQGQNSIAFNPGANARLTPQDIEAHAEVYKENDILLVTTEIGLENVYAAVRQAKSRGMFVILDPAPAPDGPIPADIPAMVDIIKPNEIEATAITGLKVEDFASAEPALQALVSMGFANPIITLGEQGSLAWIDGKSVQIQTYPVKTIDSTAAGDVFSGSLAAALSQGRSYEQALQFASAASALSTTRNGAQTSIPSMNEVKELTSA